MRSSRGTAVVFASCATLLVATAGAPRAADEQRGSLLQTVSGWLQPAREPEPAERAAAAGVTAPSSAAAASAAAASSPATAAPHAPVLRVAVDVSDSGARELRDALVALSRALPAAVEAHGVGRIEVLTFDTDGWAARVVTSIDLPLSREPEVAARTVRESEAIFGNLHRAREAERFAAIERQRVELRAIYRADLALALAKLDLVRIESRAPRQARCTDIVGVARRIAVPSSAAPVITVLVTDFAETCSRGGVPRIPNGERTPLVAWLIPDRRNPASGAAQFERQERAVRHAFSSAAIRPWFADDLDRAIAETIGRARPAASGEPIHAGQGRVSTVPASHWP